MLKTRSLGKIFGVDLKIHGTFLLLLVFVAVSGLLKGGMMQALMSLSLALVIFGVVTLHEFGHILAAKRYGIKTRDVILSPLGGVARLERAPSTPNQEIVVAVAGPLVNVVLAGLGFLFLQLPFLHLNTLGAQFTAALTSWFITINLVLVGFNLIPALPMDGGRILRAVLSKKMGPVKATEKAAQIARWSALAMALYAIGTGQFMLLIIAAFIFVMSGVELMQTKLRHSPQGQIFQLFQQFQGAQRPRSAPRGNVVDQNGNPVDAGTGGGWQVKSVRWVE